MVFTLRLYILAFALSLLSCNNQPEQVDKVATIAPDTTEMNIDNSAHYAQTESVLITTDMGDTLRYSKEEYNSIVDNHPEFFDQHPRHPDLLYYCGNDKEEFGSELGQDNYYMLYAHFLKQRNGVDKYALERKKLIDIYMHINSLFARLQYGGTYFGHQQRRILGYAEFSVYLLPKNQHEISKTYDISKQKALYIQSLRQQIEDEAKIDFNTLGKEKVERARELHRIVDELNRLITDNFYLRRAQEFQYGQYEYY